ncbi:MAG: FAD:protein FMN transferase [bacterium]
MKEYFEFKATGTSWTINLGENYSNEIRNTIINRIETFEQNYSRFRSDSLVSKMAHTAGTYTMPEDAKNLFALYRRLYDITDGMVNPFMGKTLSDAGYDPTYSLQPKENITKPPQWDAVMKYEHPTLTLEKPVTFDFGAAGKGYLVDIVAKIIEDSGIQSYMINAGGDIMYRNEKNKSLRVGLENPENQQQVVGVAEIINQSICGSAGNRRAWGEFTHIIDPKTGKSPKNILAVWVVAENTALADGLTTALFFTNPEKIQTAFKFEYAIVYADHSGKISPNFPGTFFSN